LASTTMRHRMPNQCGEVIPHRRGRCCRVRGLGWVFFGTDAGDPEPTERFSGLPGRSERSLQQPRSGWSQLDLGGRTGRRLAQLDCISRPAGGTPASQRSLPERTLRRFSAWLIGRTQVKGPADLVSAREIEDQYSLRSLIGPGSGTTGGPSTLTCPTPPSPSPTSVGFSCQNPAGHRMRSLV
jgi:hypothetical protein